MIYMMRIQTAKVLQPIQAPQYHLPYRLLHEISSVLYSSSSGVRSSTAVVERRHTILSSTCMYVCTVTTVVCYRLRMYQASESSSS